MVAGQYQSLPPLIDKGDTFLKSNTRTPINKIFTNEQMDELKSIFIKGSTHIRQVESPQPSLTAT